MRLIVSVVVLAVLQSTLKVQCFSLGGWFNIPNIPSIPGIPNIPSIPDPGSIIDGIKNEISKALLDGQKLLDLYSQLNSQMSFFNANFSNANSTNATVDLISQFLQSNAGADVDVFSSLLNNIRNNYTELYPLVNNTNNLNELLAVLVPLLQQNQMDVTQLLMDSITNNNNQDLLGLVARLAELANSMNNQVDEAANQAQAILDMLEQLQANMQLIENSLSTASSPEDIVNVLLGFLQTNNETANLLPLLLQELQAVQPELFNLVQNSDSLTDALYVLMPQLLQGQYDLTDLFNGTQPSLLSILAQVQCYMQELYAQQELTVENMALLDRLRQAMPLLQYYLAMGNSSDAAPQIISQFLEISLNQSNVFDLLRYDIQTNYPNLYVIVQNTNSTEELLAIILPLLKDNEFQAYANVTNPNSLLAVILASGVLGFNYEQPPINMNPFDLINVTEFLSNPDLMNAIDEFLPELSSILQFANSPEQIANIIGTLAQSYVDPDLAEYLKGVINSVDPSILAGLGNSNDENALLSYYLQLVLNEIINAAYNTPEPTTSSPKPTTTIAKVTTTTTPKTTTTTTPKTTTKTTPKATTKTTPKATTKTTPKATTKTTAKVTTKTTPKATTKTTAKVTTKTTPKATTKTTAKVTTKTTPKATTKTTPKATTKTTAKVTTKTTPKATTKTTPKATTKTTPKTTKK